MNSGSQTLLQSRLLDHVRRYRISTIPDAARMMKLPRADIRSTATGLMQSGQLGSESLYHTRRYLFERPVAKDGRRTGPLSERAKVNSLATLLFCSGDNGHRELLTAAEFQQHFSDLYRPSGTGRYVLDQSSGEPRLSFIRVDCGGRGRWDRIICKARRDLDHHRSIPAYDSLLTRGLFEVHILTAMERKAERIRQSLIDAPGELQNRIQVTAIPELIHLVLPQPSSFPRRKGNS